MQFCMTFHVPIGRISLRTSSCTCAGTLKCNSPNWSRSYKLWSSPIGCSTLTTILLWWLLRLPRHLGLNGPPQLATQVMVDLLVIVVPLDSQIAPLPLQLQQWNVAIVDMQVTSTATATPRFTSNKWSPNSLHNLAHPATKLTPLHTMTIPMTMVNSKKIWPSSIWTGIQLGISIMPPHLTLLVNVLSYLI